MNLIIGVEERESEGGAENELSKAMTNYDVTGIRWCTVIRSSVW